MTNIQNVDGIGTKALETVYEAGDVLLRGLRLGVSSCSTSGVCDALSRT
ncbi:hypothetical protein [Duganella sp. CF517]|nr:hypothetical protein [Duganella sp. CF517]